MKKNIISAVLICSLLAISTGVIYTIKAKENISIPASETDNSSEFNNSSVIVSEEELVQEAIQIDPQLVAEYSAITKDNIYHKMLNTVDFFNTARGIINAESIVSEVSFDVDMSSAKSYVKSVGKEYNTDLEFYTFDGKTYRFDNVEKTKQVSIAQDSKVELARTEIELSAQNATADVNLDQDSTRVVQSGEYNTYYYRADPTNSYVASSLCLFPQELTFGYLSNKNLWDITGQVTYEGRNCVIIEGTADPSYGDRFDVATFTMYVDSETGILLKYDGYNDEGIRTDYIEVTDFSLTPKLTKNSTFALDKYDSYTWLNTEEELQEIEAYVNSK